MSLRLPEIPAGVVPPQNPEAEEAVLGSMLMSAAALDVVAERLEPSDFYMARNGLVFRAALALHGRGDPVDAITVAEELDRRGDLDRIGGSVRVAELAALVPATANVAHYARLVRESATLRGLIRAGVEIARLGWEPGERSISDLVVEAEEHTFALGMHREAASLVPAADAIRPVWERIVERSQSGRGIVGVPSGFGPLDELTSGFQPGNLVVLAARPSIGKSALALSVCSHVALGLGKPVALFTLEMSESEVIERLLSMEALVESQKIRNGSLDKDDWKKITLAAGRVERAPLWIDDSGLTTMTEVRAKARRHKVRHPDLALVVVDYLQLMTATARGDSDRVREVSQISRGLKVLARELDVPVLALSQLSRQVEGRHDKRPILSDLRDSGSIEQDADLVLFIYRDEVYNPEDTDQQGVAEVNLAKQRNGPTGVIKLSFVRRYARFGELAPSGVGP